MRDGDDVVNHFPSADNRGEKSLWQVSGSRLSSKECRNFFSRERT
jgi:hypothetical protein